MKESMTLIILLKYSYNTLIISYGGLMIIDRLDT